MINFNDSRDVLPSSLAVVGIVCLSGSLIFGLFFPKPSIKGIEGKKIAQQRLLINESEDLKKNVDSLEEVLATTKFEDKPDLITPFVVNRVNAKVKENKLSLTSLRPQRTLDGKSMLQLPYVANFDGSFPGVLAFLRAFESGNDKLAVNQLQLTSSEGAGDRVSATVGLVAFTNLAQASAGKKVMAPLKDPKAPATKGAGPKPIDTKPTDIRVKAPNAQPQTKKEMKNG